MVGFLNSSNKNCQSYAETLQFVYNTYIRSIHPQFWHLAVDALLQVSRIIIISDYNRYQMPKLKRQSRSVYVLLCANTEKVVQWQLHKRMCYTRPGVPVCIQNIQPDSKVNCEEHQELPLFVFTSKISTKSGKYFQF